jgi:hypothetical protein
VEDQLQEGQREIEMLESILKALESVGASALLEQPLFEFLKLVMAAATGWVVTRVMTHLNGPPGPVPFEHAMMPAYSCQITPGGGDDE